MSLYNEERLTEESAIQLLTGLDWQKFNAYHGETFGRESFLGRESEREVVLHKWLLNALIRLNPGLPLAAYDQALEYLIQYDASKSLEQNNHAKYLLLKNGVPVDYRNEKGEIVRGKRLLAIDFDQPGNNEFLAIQQLWIQGELYRRRSDVILYVNGLPLVFIEFKAHNVDIQAAYENNLKDYKQTVPLTFLHNGFIILSNGLQSKIGSLTSLFEHFTDWKRISEEETGRISLETIIRGTCSKTNLLDIIENFILFDTTEGKVIKLVARNHQFLGVNRAIQATKDIGHRQGRLGVFWHTQGSGKSYSMVFFSQKILRKLPGDWTFLIITDRKELDTQIYETFTGVGAVTENNVQATSREDLKRLLSENHRYVFTLIHKFGTEAGEAFPVLSERRKIIVISDEAHRTQYGNLALNMRRALPNASYVGFTGTPLIRDEMQLTKEIFGDYISVYDFKRSIDDGATVPLYYENRGKKLKLTNPYLTEQIYDLVEGEELDSIKRSRLEREFAREYHIITAEKRLYAIAKDIVWHFTNRGYLGKGMVVCIDKPTAVRMYDLIIKHWKQTIEELNAETDKTFPVSEEFRKKDRLDWMKETEICVVVSQEQNEKEKFEQLGLDIIPHRVKMVNEKLDKRFKKDSDPFRLVIVCAMWMTGFDVKSLSTLYIDKPLKSHTLMQAIARANRVFKDKNNGEIIDYINFYQSLQQALAIYAEGGIGVTGSTLTGGESPAEPKDNLVTEVDEACKKCEDFLKKSGFDLGKLISSHDLIDRQLLIAEGANTVSVNDDSLDEFGKLSRDLFMKYKALMPDPRTQDFRERKDAIDAIYSHLHKKIIEVDISALIMMLHKVVDESVEIMEDPEGEKPVRVNLAGIDFEKLRQMFMKSKAKNIRVQQLSRFIRKYLDQMLSVNPMRINLYERYQEIITKYNKETDRAEIERIFEELVKLMEDMGEEEQRAVREDLDEEYLAIFDLLVKKELTKREREQVKTVSKDLLDNLKTTKLKLNRWNESPMITASVKTIILNKLYTLPQERYPDPELPVYRDTVYKYIHSRYAVGA